MQLSSQDVYNAVRRLGPVVPNKIKQELEQGDPTLINVYLSELCNEGKIKMTALKLGSSRFYYTPQQTNKLAALVQHLGEKDRRTARKLQEEGVIRAATADPLTRVSLSNIPDFAKPIQVKTQKGEETFYRWYELSSEESQQRIREIMGVAKKQPEAETLEPEQAPEAPEEPAEKETEREPEKIPETPRQSQKTLEEAQPESDFGETILAYFQGKDIEVKKFEEVRKGSEVDAIVALPTAVGRITYFCKAKSKKNSNDGDLAAAILTAKSKMLPCLYITTGSVTNKAKENPELGEVMVVELGSSD